MEDKNMNKYILTAALSFLFIVGCSTNKSNTDETTTTITLEEAKAIALAETDGEVVKQAEDYDDGATYYEIEIVLNAIKYEYKIDTSGKIISKEQENLDTQHTTNYISIQEAKDSVINYAGGGTVTSCELEVNGSAVYEIDFLKDNQAYDVKVDATTGEVIFYQADY